MTILEKVEVYGKYFMDLATDAEVEEYWDMVDGVESQAALDNELEYIDTCEAQLYQV